MRLVAITFPSGRVFAAEVMETEEEREHGVMFRDQLPEDRCLLFPCGALDVYPIWTINCRFPLDVLWLDEARRVVHMAMLPPEHPAYAPPCKAVAIVEMNAGQAFHEGAGIGSRLEVTP